MNVQCHFNMHKIYIHIPSYWFKPNIKGFNEDINLHPEFCFHLYVVNNTTNNDSIYKHPKNGSNLTALTLAWHIMDHNCTVWFELYKRKKKDLLIGFKRLDFAQISSFSCTNWIRKDPTTKLSQSLPAICINSMLTKFHWLCIMGLKGTLLFCTKIHTDGDYQMTQKA